MKKGILILSILCFIFCSIFTITEFNKIEASADNINVTSHSELIEAITNANEGDTILLADEVTITSKIDINKSLNFKAQGNRSILKYTGEDQVALLNDNTNDIYRHFNILNNARVNFEKCDFVVGYDVYGGGVYSESANTVVTFTHCTFDNLENTYGGAVCIDSGNNMINFGFTQCTFKSNQAERGGAVYIKNASVYFEYCTFEDNLALNDGSAICVENSKATQDAIVTINRSEFNRNITKSTNNNKAGVISLNETYTEIQSGENYSSSLGLGVIQNCKFASNIALKSGYDAPCGSVMYLENYKCSIDNCELSANTNQGNATIMAVYTTAKPSFALKNSLIKQNYVYGYTSALSVKSDINGHFNIINSVFIDNTSNNGENISYGPYTAYKNVTIDAMIDEFTIFKNTNSTTTDNSNQYEGNKIFTWVNVVMLVIAIAGIVASIIIANNKVVTINNNETKNEIPQEDNLITSETTTVVKENQEETETIEPINDIDINAIVKQYGLTKREGEVLDLLLQGKKRSEIADELFITTETVKTHSKNIYKKFDVKTRVELVLKLKK